MYQLSRMLGSTTLQDNNIASSYWDRRIVSKAKQGRVPQSLSRSEHTRVGTFVQSIRSAHMTESNRQSGQKNVLVISIVGTD